MSHIADAIGIVREVLEENHPDSTIKSVDSGESDYRIGTVGATVSVRAYGDSEVTGDDIDDIIDRGSSDLDGRTLEYKKQEKSHWFELHA